MTEKQQAVEETAIEYKPEYRLEDQSATIGKIAKAMAKAQTELKPAKTTAENPFFKSKYADISDVLMVSKVLASNSIAVVQGSHYHLSSNGWYVTTRLLHESGEWIRSSARMSLGAKPDNHSIGSAFTYGRRYLLSAMLGIATEDDDGNITTNRGQEVAPHKRQQLEGQR
tara:strand:- start:5348 stop:5857 length:510 start_codon:yes stop_codon:yes gene_type:complete